MITNLKRCKSTLIYTFYFMLFFGDSLLAQENYELVITEIMADPTPSNGLPEKEYIELFNRSAAAIQLNQFTLTYNTSSVRFPDAILQPGEYIIVVHRNNVADFLPYGKVIGLSIFSLLNTGTTLSLKNRSGKTVFSVSYTDKWYSKDKTQGFSLEMIDTGFACKEVGNWVSSEATLQGTPGKENSVKASKPDLTPPKLLRYEFLNSERIKLLFSEKLDSLSAISKSAYLIDKSLSIARIEIESPANQSVNISFQNPLNPQTVYTLTARNIADCSGNVLKEAVLPIGHVSTADSGDVVINEILFHPRSGGEDFVEIYNRSNKFISLKNWSLANVNSAGSIANARTIASTDFVLVPGQFLALSRNPAMIESHYYKADMHHALEMPSMPSYPNDGGTAILLDYSGRVFDRFDYSSSMHHPMIDDKAGVSLEKADYNLPSSLTSNWHSAAASEGFATPGYANSQGILPASRSIFSLDPEIFTPDGDGIDDVTRLKIELDKHGYVINANVFDINGRLVRQLAQNQVIGIQDQIEWNGKASDGSIVAVGYYVVLAELFNLNGSKQEFKAKVVVGSRY